jgi:hypothetical protein
VYEQCPGLEPLTLCHKTKLLRCFCAAASTSLAAILLPGQHAAASMPHFDQTLTLTLLHQASCDNSHAFPCTHNTTLDLLTLCFELWHVC